MYVSSQYVISGDSHIEVNNRGNARFSISNAIDDYEDVRRSRSPIFIGPTERIIYSYAVSTHISGMNITIFRHLATKKLGDYENQCFWVSGKYESPQLLNNCTNTIACVGDQDCKEQSEFRLTEKVLT